MTVSSINVRILANLYFFFGHKTKVRVCNECSQSQILECGSSAIQDHIFVGYVAATETDLLGRVEVQVRSIINKLRRLSFINVKAHDIWSFTMPMPAMKGQSMTKEHHSHTGEMRHAAYSVSDPLAALVTVGWLADGVVSDSARQARLCIDHKKRVQELVARDSAVALVTAQAKKNIELLKRCQTSERRYKDTIKTFNRERKQLRAAEAELAQIREQEPVAWYIPDRGDLIGSSFLVKIHIGTDRPALWVYAKPLYASPAPAANLKAICDRYKQTLENIAKLSATHMSSSDQIFAVASSRAALNAEASNDQT